MTDRELIALMAAAIYPHLGDNNSMKTDAAIAVDVAVTLLAEVESRSVIK